MQLTPDDTIKPDDWKASADQDVIIPVLLITLSALVSAIKLRINLYAATARYYAPDSGGTCNSVTADSRYAEYTLRWIDAVHDLKLLVQEADPTLASEEQLSSLKLGQRILGFWQRILCLRASGDLAGWKNASFPSWLKADEDAIYSVMPLYQIVRDATKNDPLPPLQPQTFSIKDWMPISGAAALEALIYRRIQGCARRVNLVYAKQGQDRVFIVTNDQDKLHWLWDHEWGQNLLGWDDGGHNYRYIFEPRRAPDSPGGPGGPQVFPETELEKAKGDWWLYYFGDAFDEWLGRSENVANSPYLNGLDIILKWRQGLDGLLKQMPPEKKPANISTIHNWAPDADRPPSASQWSNAVSVRYALACRNDNGPSPRSEWSAKVPPSKTVVKRAGNPKFTT
jgi:hypothetical protein